MMAVIEEEDQIHENEANNKTLCDDTAEQILRNLPVRSLLRFKAVCKSWCNIICDPRFVNLTICPNYNVSRIHLSGYNFSSRVELGEIESKAFRYKDVCGNEGLPWYFSVPSIDADCSDDIHVVEIFNPFAKSLYSIHVAGSCNGVLFVTYWEDTFLWNPSTREHIQLPPTNAFDMDDNLFFGHTSNVIAGLGYNSVFDEYKAILIILADCNWGYSPSVVSQLLVYSSKAGFWKEVDRDVPYCSCKTLGLGITLNGCPHWIVHDHRKNVIKYSKHIIIMFFDTVDDKFKRLPTPIRWCDDYYDEFYVSFSHSLNVLGRCLCATLNNFKDYPSATDVWVMNEYGVEESWNKLFVIPDFIIQGFQIVPLGFMNHGDELVLEVNMQKIMTYNRKTKAQKFIIGTSGYFNSVEYVTSSVSPCRFLRDVKQNQEEKKGVS